MSRGQLRANSNICADCSAQDPTWASVNRGVLVCDECCSIHRSLGRHISQVKSLRKGLWSPTQLAMVQQLVSLGANNIWEHSLLDPSQNKQGRRKPNPRDPVHPTKADFIRAKYQFLAFMNKSKDSEVNSLDDLSKQLHSSVRTANLETSLRLLSLGADPNFFHTEKGNNPLHVAAQAGQASQVELLVVYGADPGAYDSNGKTPVEHARMDGHADLSDRLLECQYELTDRLAYFLCSRKPDHRAGQHFIIPEMSDSSLDMSELAKAAKKKLQALSNHLFEELAMDVYDEVDRRENNTIWLSAQPPDQAMLTDRQTVPFLPVNPEFSSTRNQGRQKLARFNAREFATLIIDILSDARRRQLGNSTPSSQISSPTDNAQSSKVRRIEKVASSLSDDEPLYDSVASDEDYASIGDNQSMKEDHEDQKTPTKEKSLETLSAASTGIGQGSKESSGSPSSIISFTESMASSDQSDSPITLEEYMEVKRALVESQTRVQQLVQTNKELKQEISLLHNMVSKLIHENQTLKRLDGSPTDVPAMVNGQELYTEGSQIILARQVAQAQGDQRPQSMFEPRDQHRQHSQWNKTSKEGESGSQGHIHKGGKVEPEYAQQKSVSAPRLQQAELQMPPSNNSRESDYDNPHSNAPVLPPRDRNSGSRNSGGSTSAHSSARGSEGSQLGSTPESSRTVSTEGGGAYPGSGEDLALPTQDDVVKRTEKITKKIQELLVSAQEGKQNSYAFCSDKISSAVQDMASLFPQNIKDEKIKSALFMLTNGAVQLREQCTLVAEMDSSHDPRFRTQQVIQCAYNIAKAAKQLVILFE